MGTMRGVVKLDPETTALREIPRPACGPGDVVLRVRAAALCGTDLHIHAWNPWAQRAGIRLPLVLGHECAGEVVEVGREVSGLSVGDRVAAETHVPCGACLQCRSGEQHICANLRIFGVHLDGCFAEATVLPARCARRLPDAVPWEVGAIMEPLGTAVRAVDEVHAPRARLVVLGCGPIGLFAIAAARAVGAGQIVAVDPSAPRLEIARRMGATTVLDPSRDDVVARVLALTDGYGADAIVEASGHVGALKASFRYLRKGGRLALIGLPGEPIELELGGEVVFKEAKIVGIHGRRMYETWERMEALLASGGLDVAPAITDVLPLASWAKGVALAREGRACKVIFQP